MSVSFFLEFKVNIQPQTKPVCLLLKSAVFYQTDFFLFACKCVIFPNCCPQIDTVSPPLFLTVKEDTLATIFFIVSFFSEPHQQTTVQPPGHQWTGTNQSEWLLMGLGQLPQTIRKGQREINMDVWKGGVGGEAVHACVFISAGFKTHESTTV